MESNGGIGGAANEVGSAHRSGIAAWIVALGFTGTPMPGLGPDAVPHRLELESEGFVDDIRVGLIDDRSVLIQAKHDIGFTSNRGSPFVGAALQWISEVRSQSVMPTALVLAYGLSSRPIDLLGDALDKSRSGDSILSSRASRELGRLVSLLDSLGASPGEIGEILGVLHFWRIETADDSAPHTVATDAMLGGQVASPGYGATARRVLKDRVRENAAARRGQPIVDWLNDLRDFGVPLRSDHLLGPAATLEWEIDAVRQVQIRLEKRAQSADLSWLDPRLHAMNSVGAEYTLARSNYVDKVRTTQAVIVSARPGAGKSHAIARASAVLANPELRIWPLLFDAFDLVGSTEPLDVAVRCAQGLTFAMREAASQAIREGRAVFLIDSFDEVQNRMAQVTRAIGRLSDEAHRCCEFVVNTRPHGLKYLDALQGFEHFDLSGGPTHAELGETMDILMPLDAHLLASPSEPDPWGGSILSILRRDSRTSLESILVHYGSRSGLGQHEANLRIPSQLAEKWSPRNLPESVAQALPVEAQARQYLTTASVELAALVAHHPEVAQSSAASVLADWLSEEISGVAGLEHLLAADFINFWLERDLIRLNDDETLSSGSGRIFDSCLARHLLEEQTTTEESRSLLASGKWSAAFRLASTLNPEVARRYLQPAIVGDDDAGAALLARQLDRLTSSEFTLCANGGRKVKQVAFDLLYDGQHQDQMGLLEELAGATSLHGETAVALSLHARDPDGAADVVWAAIDELRRVLEASPSRRRVTFDGDGSSSSLGHVSANYFDDNDQSLIRIALMNFADEPRFAQSLIELMPHLPHRELKDILPELPPALVAGYSARSQIVQASVDEQSHRSRAALHDRWKLQFSELMTFLASSIPAEPQACDRSLLELRRILRCSGYVGGFRWLRRTAGDNEFVAMREVLSACESVDFEAVARQAKYAIRFGTWSDSELSELLRHTSEHLECPSFDVSSRIERGSTLMKALETLMSTDSDLPVLALRVIIANWERSPGLVDLLGGVMANLAPNQREAAGHIRALAGQRPSASENPFVVVGMIGALAKTEAGLRVIAELEHTDAGVILARALALGHMAVDLEAQRSEIENRSWQCSECDQRHLGKGRRELSDWCFAENPIDKFLAFAAQAEKVVDRARLQ